MIVNKTNLSGIPMATSGLDNSQLIGLIGQRDVEDLLRSTFSRSEISLEAPDYGTDLVCKIPIDGARFYPVEWRLQIKSSTSMENSTSISCRRAEQILGTPGHHWYLVYVAYRSRPAELATMDALDRHKITSMYIVDLREAIRERLRAAPNCLRQSRELRIPLSKNNFVNRNLLVHLWSICLWSQVADLLHGVFVVPEKSNDCRQLVNVLAAIRAGKQVPISRLVDVNSLLASIDPILRRPLITPLHSYYGAHLAISELRTKRKSAYDVRGCSHIENIDHLLCWIFSDWYEEFNLLAKYCANKKLRRLFKMGSIHAAGLHERILAWQMLKCQLAGNVHVTLVTDERLTNAEPCTLFLPNMISTTRLYGAGQFVDSALKSFDASQDTIDWDRFFSNGCKVYSYTDLYSKRCRAVCGLDRLSKRDLKGLGIPENLLPYWWKSAPSATSVLTR